MLKFLINFAYLIVCFILLESLLYLKDYNDLMIMNSYLKYEIKSNQLNRYEDKVFSFELSADGEYKITMKRRSLFVFEKYKRIEYNGIVD